MFKFRSMRSMDPLQVAMTGVRMGEQYLQVFCSDLTLTRGLATKAGLSGVAALAAADESQAARARSAASKAGALIDVRVVEPSTLPSDWTSFDMVVIDETGGRFSALSTSDRHALLGAIKQALRDGGRVEIIERTGAAGLFGGSSPAPPSYSEDGGAEGVLRKAGFNPVRTLAERDGFRFVEGLKG
jgi:hypothetical protein